MADPQTLADRSKAAEVESDMTKVAANEQKEKEQKSKKDKPKKDQKPKQNKQAAQAKGTADTKGIVAKKEDDLALWYSEVLSKGDFLEYSDVPGCYIYLPNSFSIWDSIRAFLDGCIKTIGVRNCQFPLFISETSLATEKEHLEGFEAEVAWVTHGGKDKLANRLAVRPTSETAMYSYYAKRIRSHRDLPLKWNQWNNVVRWEFKHAIPFLRSREFLWQEGHTAHLTKEEAGTEVLQILDFYARTYEELLAVPVVKGQKTDNEKFAGADYTTTIEGYIPAVGRGIQAATSHCLGQHFSRMFNITVEDPSRKEGETKPPLYVWQNSWGFTTRSIGVMVMIHSDNKGLVLPPRVAEIQAVIIPVGITAKTTPEGRADLMKQAEAIKAVLSEAGVRTHFDDREGYSPGFKFADWELKGIPLQIEIGPKDLEKHVITTSRRDQEGKEQIPITEIGTEVPALLEKIQGDLFARAKSAYDSHRKIVTKWEDFVPELNAKNLLLVPHCLGGECEDQVKAQSARTSVGDDTTEDARAPSMGAKSLCIPHDQPSGVVIEGETKCINPQCSNLAKKVVMFGRSY